MLFSATVATVASSMLNITLPAGMPVPVSATTDAVKVRLFPVNAGFELDVTVVSVASVGTPEPRLNSATKPVAVFVELKVVSYAPAVVGKLDPVAIPVR